MNRMDLRRRSPKRSRGRFRTGLLLGAVFVAGALAGPPAAGLLGHAFAQDSSRADTYRMLSLFGDVFERVRA